jgi:geranylgeranyl transferase type-2 subunit beta
VSWISKEKLVYFILQCQEADEGGIADRPGNMADIFHTFFGISGLSLLGYFTGDKPFPNVPINPTYALPEYVVSKYNLFYQTLPKL